MLADQIKFWFSYRLFGVINVHMSQQNAGKIKLNILRTCFCILLFYSNMTSVKTADGTECLSEYRKELFHHYWLLHC